MQTAQQPAPSRFSEKQPTLHSLIFPLIKLVGTFVVFYLFFTIQGGKAGEDSLKILTTPWFLQSIAIKGGIVAIGAIGLSIALAAGMLDLSVAAIAVMSASVANLYYTQQPSGIELTIPILFGIAAGGAVGILNGVLSGLMRLQSSAATIAIFVCCCAAASLLNSNITDTRLLFGGQSTFLPIYIAIAAGIVFQFIVRKTSFGIKLRACGANINSAREAGINVAAYGMIALVICGIFAGACGSFYWMTLTSVSASTTGVTLTFGLQILAAALLGGSSTRGGYSQPLATVIAAMVIALFFACLHLIYVSPVINLLTAGFIVLLCLIRNRMLGR